MFFGQAYGDAGRINGHDAVYHDWTVCSAQPTPPQASDLVDSLHPRLIDPINNLTFFVPSFRHIFLVPRWSFPDLLGSFVFLQCSSSFSDLIFSNHRRLLSFVHVQLHHPPCERILLVSYRDIAMSARYPSTTRPTFNFRFMKTSMTLGGLELCVMMLDPPVKVKWSRVIFGAKIVGEATMRTA